LRLALEAVAAHAQYAPVLLEDTKVGGIVNLVVAVYVLVVET
jgi:hypothetical protein